MQILSITLTNFKRYAEGYFEFQPGVNTISGENGAGKTTILEAMAWTLFDCDSGYTKDELIRRGAKSAQVSVTFISPKEGRSYRVKRCTSQGYELFDPQTNRKLPEKNSKDVVRWLKEHLRIAEGTDLRKLFADTIGIPQGTFTVDFLKSANDRRRVFDPILKVEEYRQAFRESAPLETYAREQVREWELGIAHYNSRLADWPLLKQEQQQLQEDVHQGEQAVQTLEQQLTDFRQERDQRLAQAQQLQQLTQERQRLGDAIANQTRGVQERQVLRDRAQQALEVCQTEQASYTQFQQVEQALLHLNAQQQQKQAIAQQQQQVQADLNRLEVRLAELRVQQEELEAKRQQLAQLQPGIEQQQALESDLQAIDQQLQQFQVLKAEQQALRQQLRTQETHYQALTEECDRLQALEATVVQLPELQAQVDRYQAQISRLSAARQFEAELQQLVTNSQRRYAAYVNQVKTTVTLFQDLSTISSLYTPAIEAALEAIQSGQDLNQELMDQVQQILTDLSSQVDPVQLQQRLEATTRDLKQADAARVRYQSLPDKQAQQTQLAASLEQGQTRLEELQTQLAQESPLQQQRQVLAATLQSLQDPRSRSRILEQQLQRAPQIQGQFEQVMQQQTALQTQLQTLEANLQPFQTLEQELEHQHQLKQTHQTGYLRYIQHQQEATTLNERQQALQAANDQLTQWQTQMATLQAHWQALTAEHDAERLQQLEQFYTEANDRKQQQLGVLSGKRTRLQQLATELAVRQGLAEELAAAQQELTAAQQVQQFVSDARQFYNQGAPRITRFYIDEISREADRLFRELMNRQNLALRWTEDYEIQVQEGGYWRTFKTLAGGEQMCAALAVRLALLRVFADVNIAFFDEPTTNMDRQRRQHLAEALANLKTFQQMFVISHDDTFEQITENIIQLNRD